MSNSRKTGGERCSLLVLAGSVVFVAGCGASPSPSSATGTSSGSGAAIEASSGDPMSSTSGGGTTTTSTTSATSSAGDSTTAADTATDPPSNAPPENFRVAFFGDNGSTSASAETIQLVRDEGAEVLVVLGDFDYDSDPAAWHEQLDDNLGEVPLFAAPGNHDEGEWDGYREVLMDRRLNLSEADCNGTFSEQEGCTFENVFFVLSAVGTLSEPSGAPDHEDFIADALAGSDSIWKICAWHKNQHDMQTGSKEDEVGWGAYQACQAEGAIIATGHEHSYSRTVTVTDLGNADADHGAVLGDPSRVEVGAGKTFVFVSGLGGKDIRDFHSEHEGSTWWASTYAENRLLKNGEEIESFDSEMYGVLFIDFHVDGDPYKAHAYFKTTSGEILDEFDIFADRQGE